MWVVPEHMRLLLSSSTVAQLFSQLKVLTWSLLRPRVQVVLKVNALARDKPDRAAGPEEQAVIADCGQLKA